ncbi:MAG: diguanylate cyclase [Sideroxyarcus sp.]
MGASTQQQTDEIRFGITFKLGILLAVFGVLSSGLTGYYTYTATRDILINASSQDLLQATQVMGRRFTILTNEAAKDALMYSRIRSVHDVAGSGPAAIAARRALADQFRGFLLEHPEYFQARFISALNNGIELVRADRDGDNIRIIDGLDLQEKQHYPYVYETLRLAAGEVHFSRIFLNREEGAHAGLRQPTLLVATPVADADGKALGIIVINVDLNHLFDMLKADLHNDYQIFLADQNGDYLIHPDRSKTFGFDYGRRFLAQDTFKPVAEIVNGQSESVIVRTRLVGGKQEVLGGFAKIPFGEKAERHFVIFGLTVPLDTVLQSMEALEKNSARIVIAFSLSAIALSILLAMIFVRPLKQLVGAVRHFAQTRELIPIRVRRRDELGLLAHSIAQMQEHLLAHMNEINMRKDAMEYKARHDALTGAPNREMFFDLLRFSISNARRNGTQLAVLFIDLDRFKSINDNFGHAAGDAVLVTVVQRLKEVMRESDAVARLSGDEFGVLIQPAEDEERIAHVAQKIIDVLHEPIAFGKANLKTGASIGISIFSADGDTPEALLHNADAAMYNSKRKGRGVFCFYTGMQ